MRPNLIIININRMQTSIADHRLQSYDDILNQPINEDTKPDDLVANINYLMENCFFEDSVFANYIIYSPQMKQFSLDLFKYWLAILNKTEDDLEIKLSSFLKVLMTKTNFVWITQFLKVAYLYISKNHLNPLFDHIGVYKILNILHTLSNINSIVPKTSYLLLSGIGQSNLTVEFNKKFEAINLFFNKNFCILVNFTIELLALADCEEPVYLFNFRCENPETGYGVYFFQNKLFFYYKLPTKAPNSLNEFIIFDDVSMLVSNKWNHFSFSCQFDALNMTSNLLITLNYQKFTGNYDFANFISSQYAYKLHLFTGVPSHVSTVTILNRSLTEMEFVKLQNSNFQHGVLNFQTLEFYNQLFSPEIQKSHVLFLWHGLGISNPRGKETELVDFQTQTKMIMNEFGVPINLCPNAFPTDLLKNRFAEVISVMFNYIKTKEELTKIIRIMKSLVENRTYSDLLLNTGSTKIVALILSALLCTESQNLIDETNFQQLIFGFTEQSDKNLKKYVNRFLLNFHFLDQLLKTEITTKAFFAVINKSISENLTLIHHFDMNNLLNNAIIFLHRGDKLSIFKGVQLLKLLGCSMTIQFCANKFDVSRLLLYFTKIEEIDTIVQIMLLKILKEYVGQKPVEKSKAENFYVAIANMLIRTNDAYVMKKCIKVALMINKDSERFLIYAIRCKYAKNSCLEKTKKIFFGYLKEKLVVNRCEILLSYVMRGTFTNMTKENVFSNDSMAMSPNGLTDLLFEISLLSDVKIIEKVIQAFYVAMHRNEIDFIAKTGKKHLLAWILSLMFKYYKSSESESIFDMSKKILMIYVSTCAKNSTNLDFFNQIAELVHFGTMETSKHEIKYIVLIEILMQFNAIDSFIMNEIALNQLLLSVIKYYYINIHQEKLEDYQSQLFEPLFIFLHGNVNMNPAPNFVSTILDKIDRNENTSRISLSSSMISMFTRTRAQIKPESCTLKLITIFSLDLLNQLFTNPELKLMQQSSFEFISAYAYRFLNYLENNRSKIKAEKAYTIEVCLYYLYKFVIENESKIKSYEDIMKSVYFFADESIYKQSFGKKIIAAITGNKDSNERFGDMNLKKKSILLEEYKDGDFEEAFENFVLDSVGKINHIIQADISSYDVYFTIEDVETFTVYTSSGLLAMKIEYGNFLSFCFYTEKIRLRSLLAYYKKTITREFQVNGMLADPSITQTTNDTFTPNTYDSEKNLLLSYKVNSYITTDRKRPFVKLKMVENWKAPIFQDNFSLNENFTFEGFFNILKIKYHPCQLISKFTIIQSLVCLVESKQKIKIFIDYNQNDTLEKGHLKQFVLETDQSLVLSYSVKDLKNARPYKFLRRKTACRIERQDRQDIILNFQTPEVASSFMEDATKMIFSARNKPYIQKESIYALKSMVERWRLNQISNFSFLMRLNSFGSRSFEDFSQYPIMPLVMKEFDHKIILRDLEKPIGMAGDSKRVSRIVSRFQSVKSFDDVPPFHYGSHYSNPTTVFNFLMRLCPFDEGCKLIHNGSFDMPDRLFFSINTMLKNINEENCDLRELIPEFFSSPEMFLNLNNFDMGINHEGIRIHNVQLPTPCQQNPYLFVFYMVQLLESENVSSRLHYWVDLIFGYKQLGDEAKKNNNLFYHLTYEETNQKQSSDKTKTNDLDTMEDSVLTQVYHFGQTPFQLFQQQFKPRDLFNNVKSVSSMSSKLKYFIRLRSNDTSIEREKLLYFKRVRRSGSSKDPELSTFVAIYEERVEIWKINENQSTYNVKNPFNLLLESTYKMDMINNELALMGQLTVYKGVIEVYMFNKMIFGGIPNGFIAIFVFNFGTLVNKQHIHDYTVVNLLLTPKEMLISSDIRGIIKISKLNLQTNVLSIEHTLYDFVSEKIYSLHFPTADKNLFGFQTNDAVVLRSTDCPDKHLFELKKSSRPLFTDNDDSEIVFSFGYVGVLVLYVYKEKTNRVHVFNLQGEMISSYKEKSNTPEEPFKFFEIIRDEFFKDYLTCITAKGDVTFLDLPFFETKKQYKSYQNITILKVAVVNKRRTLLLMDDQKCVDIICVNEKKDGDK